MCVEKLEQDSASPLVSVVMPAYNAQFYISAAIESILEQTYENFELIIIEDCSTDDTLMVIKQFKDFRIKLLQNESNKGIAYSTNKGIACSKGKYIALMDDDDIAVIDRLKLQVNYLENHLDIDILGGRSNDIDQDGNLIREGVIPRYNPKYIRATLLFKCMNFRNGTAMIRKDFIDRYDLWYEEDCYGMQDFKFFIHSSKKRTISTISDLLHYYRVHDKNVTIRRRQEYGEQRKATYARFQRESLKESGFELSEEKLLAINRIMAENNGGCTNRKDLQMLYEIFREIIRQAKIRKVDYCGELESLCKLVLSEQVRKLIYF